jgi:histidinol phosphatase-like PHP family hydrolase
MIDLHTHSLFSDGALIPSELVYRAKVRGYTAIAITDHGDFSNMDFVIPRIKNTAKELSSQYNILVIPGIELTYVPPKLISKAVKMARRFGAKIVVVHGETPAETVPEGTNLAGVLSGADILAHPGYITENEVKLAVKNNVCLEITSRNGHNKTNPHVAALALKFKAKLVLNSDTHEPENLLTEQRIQEILQKAGLTEKNYKTMLANSLKLVLSKTKD